MLNNLGFSLLVGGRPPREGKSLGNEVGVACGLCVNKIADATLSSEDEEIETPLKLQLAGELCYTYCLTFRN